MSDLKATKDVLEMVAKDADKAAGASEGGERATHERQAKKFRQAARMCDYPTIKKLYKPPKTNREAYDFAFGGLLASMAVVR